MRKGSFKELIVVLRNQDFLRSQGLQPYGWWRGKLLWSSKGEGNITKIIEEEEIEEYRVYEIDTLNCLLV